MRICWFGIYRTEYPRNDILLEGLKELGIEVVECKTGPLERFRYLKLIFKLLKLKNVYDVVYCAYPSQGVVPIAKLFSRKPVAMDAFFSMYDSIVEVRGEHGKFHPRALKFLFLDWLSVFLADLVIADTREHKRYWATWRGMSEKKIGVVYIGVNTKAHYPIKAEKSGGSFLVQYHGSYIPLQGLDKIVDAVDILRRDPSIRFRFIGSGQDFEKTEREIRKRNIKDVEFIKRIPYREVNTYLNEADVIFGIFGDVKKTDRVVPNKVFEGMAVAKPVVTKDTPAIRELFSEDEIVMVKNTGEDIAEAVTVLRNDAGLRQRIAQRGYHKVIEKSDQKAIASQLMKHLKELLTRKSGSIISSASVPK